MSRSSRLLHREPIPRGFIPKLKHYTKGMPSLNIPLAALAVLALLVYPTWRFTQTSEYFEINSWQVEGLSILTESEIMWLMGVDEDETFNIFAFDQQEASKLVTDHPSVLHTVVEKQLPNQVSVFVYERSPEALLVTEKDMLLVDFEGVVFAKATSDDLLQSNLPIFTVGDGTETEIGDSVSKDFLNMAILYQKTLQESGSPLALEISEYHQTAGSGLDIILRNGMILKCGLEKPSKTIPKYNALIRELDDEVPVRYVDLRLDSHVPWKPGAPRFLPTIPPNDFANLQ